MDADPELVDVARAAIGAQFGLTEAQSKRLTGSSAAEIRTDARLMAKELGLVADDDPPRDRAGRYAKSGGIYDQRGPDMNRIIREAAGRTS
jgi:hypothetical protein